MLQARWGRVCKFSVLQIQTSERHSEETLTCLKGFPFFLGISHRCIKIEAISSVPKSFFCLLQKYFRKLSEIGIKQ